MLYYTFTAASSCSLNIEDIITLAELLGRTPSSISLKMANLGHYDAQLAVKHIKMLFFEDEYYKGHSDV